MTAAPTEAYAYCERLARSHYENFPVASRMLPAAMRPHIAAVYAFARIADDMADEGDRATADRLADLDAWGRRLDNSLRSPETDRREHWQVFAALRHTVGECRLPVPLCLRERVYPSRCCTNQSRAASLASLNCFT